jgi:hypothetical protein
VNQKTNHALSRGSIISIPPQEDAFGKLVHEIGRKVRVLLKKVGGQRSSRRCEQCSVSAQDSALQGFTLHPEGISRTRIAVNTVLHPIK